jgi:predicted dehydrogenase
MLPSTVDSASGQQIQMKPVRFAILGTAKIARVVGPRIQAAAGAVLSGVASRSRAAAAGFAEELQIPGSYGSYAAALEDPDIDAVYIPLPPSMHLEWATKAAEAGKHVLCEKPLAMTAGEADRMISVCRQHNVVLLDGVMWYHTPRAAAIKRTVESGQLGDLKQLTSVFTFRWDEFPLDNVRMQRELGGGSLLDLGWYCVGAALWLFNDMPHRVFARAQYHNNVDTRLNGFLEFSDGRVATIECGFDTVKRRWVEVAGSDGNLVCDDFTRPWDENKPRFWTHDDRGQATEHVIRQQPQEEHMIESFCELVRTGATSHPWLELAKRTQRVCDALARSAHEDAAVGLTNEPPASL